MKLCFLIIFLQAALNVGRVFSGLPRFTLQLERIDPRVDAFRDSESQRAEYESDDEHFVHTARIGFGVPPQFLNVEFNTGIYSSRAFSERFDSCNLQSDVMRKTHRFYDSNKSYSFSYENKNTAIFTRRIDKHWAFGYQAQDLLTMYTPNQELIQETFMEMAKASKEFLYMKGDAVIALRFHAYAVHRRNFVTRLCGGFEVNFSFYFPRNKPGQPEDPAGKLMFCGIDQTLHLPGKMQYVADISPGEWKFTIDSVQGYGTNGSTITISNQVNGKFESNIDHIYGPTREVEHFHRLINASSIPNQLGRYQVDCNVPSNHPGINFVIQGENYKFYPADYIRKLRLPDKKEYCEVLIRPFYLKKSWLFGETFLRAVYVVFDMDNHKIGFGQTPTTS